MRLLLQLYKQQRKIWTRYSRSTSFATVILITAILVLSGCSISNNISKDQKLLVKNNINVDKGTVPSSDLEGYLQQDDNKKFLGLFNMNVWAFGTKKNGKPRSRWMRSIAGEPPALFAVEEIKNTESQMKSYLSNRGYFNAIVEHDVKYYGKDNQKVLVTYNITAEEPYRIKTYSKNIENHLIDSLILYQKGENTIQVGDIYDYYKLEKQRDNITEFLHNNGFYYFAPDYVFYEIDSSFRNHELSITLNIRDNYIISGGDSAVMDPRYCTQYRIRDIYINSQVDPLRPNIVPTDTLDFKKVVGNKVVDTVSFIFLSHQKQIIHPRALAASVIIEPNELYNLHDASVSRKNILGLPITKYVKLSYVPVLGSDTLSDSHLLDCFIGISRSERHSFRVEGEGTNDNGAFGISGKFTFKNRNIFRGGEMLSASIIASAEMQNSLGSAADNSKMLFNTLETGAEVSLTFPRFLGPIKQRRFSKYFRPSTTVSTGVNVQQRPDYDRTLFKASFGWTWKRNTTITHTLKPIELNVVNIFKSDEFEEYLQSLENPRLYEQYSNHFIMDLNYTLTYNSQTINKNRNFSFLKASFESAGNMLYGINSLFDSPKTETGHYTIFNIRYAQYIRCDFDFRRYFVTGKETMFVARSMVGIGTPYGNAEALPFEKGYYAGGSNGMRGWEMYSLGPGEVVSANYGNFERVGDIKLELNAEFRFPIYSYFKGAVFVDAGNIWLMNQDPDFVGGEFKFDSFYSQIATDVGVGFRLDFDYFLIRLDPAFPIFDPGRVEGSRWVIKNLKFSDGILNFGIGYPF